MALTTATEFESLPPWLQGMVKDISSRSEALSQRPYERYPQQRLANIPEDIKQAHELGRRIPGSYLDYLRAAEGLTKRGSEQFSQRALSSYMNPYQKAVIDRIAEEGGRSLREQIMPALEATFVNLGQHGSSRHRDLAQRAARDLQAEISAKQAEALMRGYQQAGQLFNADQLRALEAGREMAGLGTQKQGAQLADISALTEQGRYQQQQEQAQHDIAYEDFLRHQQHAPQILAEHQATIHGLPAPSQRTTFTQVPMAPQTNVIGNLGSLAGQMLGARLAATPRKRGGHIQKRRFRKSLSYKAI